MSIAGENVAQCIPGSPQADTFPNRRGQSLLLRCGDVEQNPGPPGPGFLSSEEQRWGRVGNGLNTINRVLQTHLQTELKALLQNMPR